MLSALLLLAAALPHPPQTPARAAHEGAFLPNGGQWPAEVRFVFRGSTSDVTVLDGGFVVRPHASLASDGGEPRRTAGLAVQFLDRTGLGSTPTATGRGPGSTPHHFHGPAGSITDLRAFDSVLLDEVAPGVDVVLRNDGGRIAYDLEFEAGARSDTLEVEFGGLDAIEQVDGGELRWQVPGGSGFHRLGRAWTEGLGTAREVAVAQHLDVERGRLTYEVASRSLHEALVIDPTVGFLTYLGGPNVERFPQVERDAQGRAVILTEAAALAPTLPGGLQESLGGVIDAWLGRFSPDGSALEFATYLGGSAAEAITKLELGADDAITVVGRTNSTDFPETASLSAAPPGSTAGFTETFVTRLTPDADGIVWSFRFGYQEGDQPKAAAVAPDGAVYLIVEGPTSPAQVPPVPPPLPPLGYDDTYDSGTNSAEGDDLLLRIDPAGTTVTHATWFSFDYPHDMQVSAEGHVVVSGMTADSIPATAAAAWPLPTGIAGLGTGYVVALEPDLSDVAWGTYVGGGNGTCTFRLVELELDAAGAIHLAGLLQGTGAAVHGDAFQPSTTSASCGYVAKLSPRGTRFLQGTLLGEWGSSGPTLFGTGYIEDISVDSAGRAVLVGAANATGWPVTADAFQPAFSGPFGTPDAALTLLDAAADGLVFSTWVGGGSNDWFVTVDADPDGRATLAFDTSSPDLVATPGAFDPALEGGDDVVVLDVDLGAAGFELLGGGLFGAEDRPVLVGTGGTSPGASTRLVLRGAEPSAPGFLVAGFTELWLPLFGGTLVPSPDLVEPIGTDVSGAWTAAFSWPGLPTGTTLTSQAWILDPLAGAGLQASNGLRAVGE